MTCPDARDQQDRREQPRNELHNQPQSKTCRTRIGLSQLMQDTASVLRDQGFVQMAVGVPVKFKSIVAWGMRLPPAAIPNRNIKAARGASRAVKRVFAVDRG